ncbi:hypothetical protein CSA56_12435 [candidate division KSB3 bacterium]|uniref:Uncharacterized protein n=1 Tax=candidate division KSB3 bacterium TaxID=2044937 RepID=A0A2G6KC78_9BACT|nr:MAG: hypothetical protein CSA56_12435 [candidate division KSB3 bacterium]
MSVWKSGILVCVTSALYSYSGESDYERSLSCKNSKMEGKRKKVNYLFHNAGVLPSSDLYRDGALASSNSPRHTSGAPAILTKR